jgi:hypothetical protein
MHSEVIPPLGTRISIKRWLNATDDRMPAEVVAHLSDIAVGDVLELRPLGSRKTLQRAWPSPAIELPPAA